MRKQLQDYINTPVTFENDGVWYDGVPIMNGFEKPLIDFIADSIVHRGGSVLNIGYGSGFFDKRVQEIGVRVHTIMECHPNVVANIDAPFATIYVGPWQEHIETLIENGQKYDCVFFDTYDFDGNSMEYEWFKFMEYAESLLNPKGKVSMFTWLGKDCTKEFKEGLKNLKLYEEEYEINDYKYKHLYWEKSDEKEYGNEQNGYDVEKGLKEN